MKEKEGRHNATVKAFNVAEKRNQELKKKLLEEERERKSVAVAFDSAEKQAKSQRVLLHNTEDQLAGSKLKSPRLRRNWRKPKRQRSKQRGLRIRLSKMGTTPKW